LTQTLLLLRRLQTKAPPSWQPGEAKANKRQRFIHAKRARLIASLRALALPIFAWHLFV
jgi:hypothetical protein